MCIILSDLLQSELSVAAAALFRSCCIVATNLFRRVRNVFIDTAVGSGVCSAGGNDCIGASACHCSPNTHAAHDRNSSDWLNAHTACASHTGVICTSLTLTPPTQVHRFKRHCMHLVLGVCHACVYGCELISFFCSAMLALILTLALTLAHQCRTQFRCRKVQRTRHTYIPHKAKTQVTKWCVLHSGRVGPNVRSHRRQPHLTLASTEHRALIGS